jgi:DNA-directed RNA polymerase subunit E'/Rpb7
MWILLQDRVRVEETQTPAQRQAAAKLALRKQLEKTLLQVGITVSVLHLKQSQRGVLMPVDCSFMPQL